MLRNKKYGMGGAVQSFSSPMLAQGMQGNLSGFGTSGLQTFAKGGEVGSSLLYEKVKHINKKYDGVVASKTQRDNKIQVVSPFFNTLNEIKRNEFDGNGLLQRDVNSNGYVLYSNAIFAKGGEIIDQYEGRIPADIWFNLTKSQRRHLLLDHANIPSGEISMYVGYDTNYDDLPHFVKQIIKKHFAEGQYAKGGKTKKIDYLRDAKELSEDERFELKVLQALGGFNNGLNINGLYESIGFSNYRFNQYATESQSKKVQKALSSLIKKEYVDESGLGYKITQKGASYKREFNFRSYAKGGQIASIGDSGIITDKNSMFVGKMALITGDLGNMYEVRVGERTTIVKKNGIRIVSDEYAHGGEIHNSAKQMSDEDFEMAYNRLTPSEKNDVKILIRLGDDKKLALATILAESKKPSSSDFYKRAYEYADGGKTRKSGNVPRIAKKVAEVNALIEKGNSLGLEVVDTSTTWQSPMKYKPIKYVNGILYIEYEKLDLYALSKRGVQKWDIQKDKVLKRNMEFDNPLNDIAKMYRKAIREREQYFADGGDVEEQNMDVQFIEYNGNEIMYEPHYKKYYANDVEFDSLLKAKKFLDSGKVSSNIRGAYKKGLFAQGGQIKPKTSRITLIMDGQKYSYPVALVNGRVEVTEETFKDGVVREYLDKEFDLWLQQAPTDYEEMYYGDEDVMSKSGAIEGGMEIVISTIEQEAPKKTTFNFDEGDVEFYEAYQYAKGGKIGFEGLAKKVAKRYVGRNVSKEYQAEYGKTYDAKEAKEVGNKVAGKVYQQQVAKKKIVRKLQRKTN